MSRIEVHEQLLSCVCAALAATADSPDLPVVGGYGPVRSGACCLTHAAGLPAADYCCEGTDRVGQAWVRTIGFDPVNFGDCGNANTVNETIGAGVYRCSPSFRNNEGEPPSCDELTLHAKRMRLDADAIRDAVRCCPVLVDASWQFVTMVPIGGEGACCGWEYRLRLRWDEPRCPIRTPAGLV